MAFTGFLVVGLCAGAEQPVPSNRGVARGPVGFSISREWIPASGAFTETGEFRPDLFPEGHRSLLDEIQKKNPTRCVGFLGPFKTDTTATIGNSLDELVSSSRIIVRGRLYQAELGFYLLDPGTLFTLLPDSVLKTDGSIDARSALFLFIPEGVIATSKGFICSRTSSKIPTPAVGDEVLLFVSLESLNIAGDILRVDTKKQLVVNHDGRVFAPAAIEPSPDRVPKPYRSLDDLEWAIKTNARLGDPPKGQQR